MKRLITVCVATAAAGWLAVVQAAPADTAAKKTQVQQAAPAQSEQGDQEQAAPAGTKSADEQLTELKGKVDGLDEPLAAMKSTVDKLSKIKISGYVQTQFRMATDYKSATDTAGTGAALKKSNLPGTYLYPVGDFAGGKIGNGIGSLFQIRRARIKIAYETDLTQAAIQTDFLPFTAANATNTTPLAPAVTQSKDTVHGRKFDTSVSVAVTQKPSAYLSGGGVTIKDVYLRFTEPWLRLFSLRAGVFNRPFGFEIGYSSSDRESPERSRAEQTLFPGERDLGLSLEMLPGDNAPAWLQYFNFKGGAFTGNGINVESDDARDYIGRFGISCPFKDIGLGIDAGVSGYFGKVTDWNDAAYSFNADSKAFAKSTGNYDKTIDRTYYGADAQLYYSLPVVGGLTLRGEYYTGMQPAGATSTSSLAGPNVFVLDPNNTSAVYSRHFLGFYAMYVQNFDPLKSQLVLKYDSYDPNTDIQGSAIDSARVAAGGVSAADLMFNTFGIGWVYHWDENLKFILYMDMPQNEKISNRGSSTYFSQNASGNAAGLWPYLTDMKANVFTFRIQYKF